MLETPIALCENPDSTKSEEGDDQPVTFLHAEAVTGVRYIDQPHPGFVAENDTFIQGSGDSDTN